MISFFIHRVLNEKWILVHRTMLWAAKLKFISTYKIHYIVQKVGGGREESTLCLKMSYRVSQKRLDTFWHFWALWALSIQKCPKWPESAQSCQTSKNCKRLPSYTGQELACSTITQLVVCLSPCRKWPNTQENSCWLPPSDHTQSETLFETRKEEWMVEPVFCIVDTGSCSIFDQAQIGRYQEKEDEGWFNLKDPYLHNNYKELIETAQWIVWEGTLSFQITTVDVKTGFIDLGQIKRYQKQEDNGWMHWGKSALRKTF